MASVKKANVSNHDTSPVGRNKMSQLFFVELVQQQQQQADRLKMIKFPSSHNLLEVAIQ